MPKVKLIAKTPNMLKVMYVAAHACYSDREPGEIFDNGPILSQKELDKIWSEINSPQEFLIASERLKNKKMLGTVQGCIEREHSSVMTHGNFTFTVSGVSISMVRQLFRHHTGVTFDEKSLRYVKFSQDNEFILPSGLNTLNLNGETKYKDYITGNHAGYEYGDDLDMDLYIHLERSKNLYERLTTEGNQHREDARYILPVATPTHFTMTINLTAFLHIWKLRAKHSTGKAQQEIADFMDLVCAEIIKAEPWLRDPLDKIAFETEELKKFKTELNVRYKQRLNVN